VSSAPLAHFAAALEEQRQLCGRKSGAADGREPIYFATSPATAWPSMAAAQLLFEVVARERCGTSVLRRGGASLGRATSRRTKAKKNEMDAARAPVVADVAPSSFVRGIDKTLALGQRTIAS